MKLTYDIIIALGEKYNYGDIDIASSYGEPGYRTDKEYILFSNWNKYPKHVVRWLKKHAELEWSDEWIITHDGESKAYRTKPDCYSWTPSYWMSPDGEIYTQDDVNKHPESYIEEIKNDYNLVNLFKLPLEKLGFTLLDYEYENGWYYKNDSPKEVLEKLEREYPNHDIIFTDLSNEQFRTNFRVAIRKQA